MFYRFTWRKQSTTAISIGRPGRGKVRREEGQRMKEKDTIYENLFRKVAFQDDEQAFKELFLEFYPALCVFAMRYVLQEETAKDLVQASGSVWLNNRLLAGDITSWTAS